jgi:hypothetical protein
MQVEPYFPTDKQVSEAKVMFNAIEAAKAISRERASNGEVSEVSRPLSVDACVKTIVGCHTFEQIKVAGNYCALVLERMYPFPKSVKKKEEAHFSEGQRDSLSTFLREKLLQKAKELTPYHSEIPDEELSQILWN